MGRKVAVLGAGKIGEAIARCLASSPAADSVIVTKRNISTVSFDNAIITVSDRNDEAAERSEVIIIAVKAGDARKLLKQIEPHTTGKLVISVMAAVSISKLKRFLPNAKIVRAMPNIAASIGESITAFCAEEEMTQNDISSVKEILSTFGETVRVKESQMDAVTALSGSGPAYIAIIIDAMISAGLKVGLPRDISFRLVTKTLTGTANMLSSHPMHPAELRDTVTTPAGTTIAGIYELEKGAVRTAIMNAVEAATEASRSVAMRFEEELNS
ncbi:MAG: pyrroline-5-carboxylate reductase [Thermoplasmata archaeon]|uniref:Pyrroline-5-carboxylate reductase n=1 Tax=Candidatus Sysuiplasma superficiale TaxID=2823368 RepID=A0A8J7YPI9_9ARCH|nr:pyrroline-5-carboxylate reductase [Candidatus Sysuiplasma superficiale]MBX8643242.1 pyrroline-5-carboxylate reductase [Candidatus Sysuiplasma superficiale]MCL4346989.1 pyrroline-5-carboxylate reductase [Candidatus Thermoplasmatota archaeon]